MRRREAEKLLGGHAAGILTEAEKQVLFAAALAHQEVFDALVDEEALRELLADPQARQRLLAALAPAPVPRLWRRPAFIGLAASLFALVTTGLVVLRHPEVLSFRRGGSTDDGAPVQAAVPRPGVQAEAAPSVVPPADLRKRQQFPARKEKVEVAPPAPVEAPAKAAAESSMNLAGSVSDRLSFGAAPAGGAPRPAPPPPMAKGALERARSTVETRLERLPGGLARLQVVWRQEGHLYVLKRGPSGALVLPAGESAPGPPGARTAVFEFSLTDQEQVDVYVLDTTVADPEALPAQGPVAGLRRRVFPE